MGRDLIDVHRTLNLEEFMRLDMDVRDDDGNRFCFINPSASKNHIYFRALLRSQWSCIVCLYHKASGEFCMIPRDSRCPFIEDLRLFDYEGKLWFVGFMRRGDNGVFETYIGYFNAACTCIEHIEGCIRVDGVHVKNITPLKTRDELWLIDIYTGIVYDKSGREHHKLDTTLIGERMKEYTNPIYGTTPYVHVCDEIYGGLVHITKRIGSKLFYVYLWVEIDTSTWKVCFVSEPYAVYAFGLVFVTHVEKINQTHFQLMFGYKDKVTCRGVATLEDLRGVTNQSAS